MDKKNYRPSVEYNSPEFGVFVETAGYRSAKQQIESFIYAGETLKAAREGSFDSSDEDPVDDPSLDVRDLELSEIGAIISSRQFETPKGVSKGETGVSVSPLMSWKVLILKLKPSLPMPTSDGILSKLAI